MYVGDTINYTIMLKLVLVFSKCFLAGLDTFSTP